MKIGPLDIKQPPNLPPAERKSVTTPPKSTEPSARVELKSQAAQQALAAQRGDFDGAKVERIAQAIRDGKFIVDPEIIADRLIANAQELLRKPST